jgi:tetratricopeptide (TPR) repeat protein
MAGVSDEREARAMYLLGLLLSGECRYELAEALLLAALDYMPGLVAARVELGVVYCGLERYGEMAGEFREAIRLDARAVRAAVREEPKELEELWRILYPPPEAAAPQEQHHRPSPPADIRESAALLEFGRGEIAAGRAVRACGGTDREGVAARPHQQCGLRAARVGLPFILGGGGEADDGE